MAPNQRIVPSGSRPQKGFVSTLYDEATIDVGVMIGRREICGLGTLGVTASLAPIGNRISFARAVNVKTTNL
jgi:hypothetical protein